MILRLILTPFRWLALAFLFHKRWALDVIARYPFAVVYVSCTFGLWLFLPTVLVVGLHDDPAALRVGALLLTLGPTLAWGMSWIEVVLGGMCNDSAPAMKRRLIVDALIGRLTARRSS